MEKQSYPLTPMQLIEYIANYFGFTYEELCEGRQGAKIEAKKIIVGILTEDYKMTRLSVGHLLKRRHCSIVNLYEGHNALFSIDKNYRIVYLLLRKLTLHDYFDEQDN